MYMNMNAEKIVKIVLLVIMFCTLVGCSFCKIKESFSANTEKLEKDKVCSYKLGTEGCIGYNCVKYNGKQYEPDHGSCKTEFCNCADNEVTDGNSLCVCDNIVDGLPDQITFTSNDNDYEFNIHLDYKDKKELYYVNKNDPDDEIYEYYKYDRQNNMFVPKKEEPTTFLKIKILNVDNMYDVKIEVDGKVFSFKVSGDTKVSCSSNEKLTQLYDNEGKYNNSFCFDDSESGFDDPGPHKIKVLYDYEKIYDDNVKCHESCKSCGFSDDPSGDSDCITCKDGYKLHPVYPDGTGKCIKVNDNKVKPTEEPLIAPDVTSTNESKDGPTKEKDDNFNVKLKNNFLYKLEFDVGMSVNSFEAESVEKDSVPTLIFRNEDEVYEYKYNEKTKLYEDGNSYLSFSKGEDNKLIIKDEYDHTGSAIEIKSLSDPDNSKLPNGSSCKFADDCQSNNCIEGKCENCDDFPCGFTLNDNGERVEVDCTNGKCMWDSVN